jgi:hypothetical protein
MKNKKIMQKQQGYGNSGERSLCGKNEIEMIDGLCGE